MSRKMRATLIRTAGAIVLAVISSAIWDLIRPAAASVGNLILTIFTLGLTELKDAVYIDVARGAFDRFGFPNGMTAIILLMFASTFLFIYLRDSNAEVEGKWREAEEAIEPDDSEESDRDIEEVRAELRAAVEAAKPHLKSLRRTRRVALLSQIFVVLTFFGQAAQVDYTNRAAGFIQQLQIIDAPFIDQAQRLQLASRAARIRGRSDYIGLVGELQLIAQKNNLTVPDFSVW